MSRRYPVCVARQGIPIQRRALNADSGSGGSCPDGEGSALNSDSGS